jgi:N-acetylglutamate synthase-like GNAT family acetyltransferase
MFKLFESGYLKLGSALSKIVNSSMRIEVAHNLSANEVAAVEQRLYEFNREEIGARDGRNLGLIIRDETGDVVGAALGYTWAGIAELRQLWVAEGCRGRGMGCALLDSFVDEAVRRGVKRIWLTSYDFQAPLFYERAGFVHVADIKDWPIGHTNSIFCRAVNDD